MIFSDNISKHIKLNDVPISMFVRTFNTAQYRLGMTIFYSNDNTEYIVPITQQAFVKLVIRNSLDGYFPTAILQFKDMQGVYTSLLHHVGQYVRIVVQPPDSTLYQNEKLKKLDLYFSIQNHQMIKYENKIITYRLQCKFWTAKNLAMHINYATFINKNQTNQLNPYQLIFNFLKKIDYPIKQQYIPNSQHKIYYITDQNNTIKDAIEYCLYYGCTANNPPTYLFHHLIDNQPVLINQMFVPKNYNYQINMGLILPSDKGSQTQHVKWLSISQPQLFSANQSLLHYQERALDVKWCYNHLTRQWTQEIVTPEKITKLLTITDDTIKTIKTSFYKENYKEGNIRHYKYNWETNIYQKYKDLDLGTNNIRFKVAGNILRDTGQFINIHCQNINYNNIFGGIWQVYSVLHIFCDGDYTNDIIGYRTYNLNYEKDEQIE